MVRTNEAKAFISVHQQWHKEASALPRLITYVEQVQHFISIDFGDSK